MSYANGGDHKERQYERRGTILPWWLYLLLGFMIVGLIRFLDWIHQ